MTHREFVDAYRAGQVRVEIEAPVAARYLSARLLLPFVALPVLGCGVALALVGWFWTGLGVLAAGVALPRLIKRSAPHFLLTQALEDAQIYDAVTQAGILHVRPVDSR